MKARVKMPPGRRDRSLRSSASSDITEIRVLFAICRRETPRFSRASRRRAPTVRAGGTLRASDSSLRSIVRKPPRTCQTPAAARRRQFADDDRPISPAGGTKRPIPAMPAAPARAASAARSTVMPANGQHGNARRRTARARNSSRVASGRPCIFRRGRDTACRRSDSRRRRRATPRPLRPHYAPTGR